MISWRLLRNKETNSGFLTTDRGSQRRQCRNGSTLCGLQQKGLWLHWMELVMEVLEMGAPEHLVALIRALYSRLQMTHETAANMFQGCLARKSLWFRNFTASSTKWFEARDTRNLSHEATSSMWINFYTHFISRMFSRSKHILRTSCESSVASL